MIKKMIEATMKGPSRQKMLQLIRQMGMVACIYTTNVMAEERGTAAFHQGRIHHQSETLKTVGSEKIGRNTFSNPQPGTLTKSTLDKIIKGKVTSTNTAGTIETLPGVNVLIKGTSKGSITDTDGNYSIEVPENGSILMFSFVGYASQEVKVTNSNVIDVRLVPDTKALDEIVVIGYGTAKKSDLAGAVTSISESSIKQMPVTSMEQAMQGRMPGVQVQQSSGQPGAGISIRVRGASSIAGGNEPLYVIDGLPQYNDDPKLSNGLATINPSDIASIEVLKDAASTAIYGSRGSNGVVMITTKTGRVGKPVVSYESSVGIQSVRKKLDMMGSEEYLDYTKQYYVNSNIGIPTELANYNGSTETDWQNEVFRTAISSNNNLSVSGGSDKTKYYISTGYLDQQGIVENSGYKRAALRLNVDSKVTERFSVQGRMTLSRGIQKGFSPGLGDNARNFGKSGIGSTLQSLPVAPVYNADGSYAGAQFFTFNAVDNENPVAFAKEAVDRNTTTRAQGGVDFRLVLAKNLTNNTRMFGDFYHTRKDLYFPRVLRVASSGIGFAQLGNYDKLSVLLEDYLEYKVNLNEKINFDVIAGVSLQKDRNNTTDLEASGFGSDNLKNYNFASATSTSKPITDVVEQTIASAFGRVRFSFFNKYLFSASLRRDGASVFAENNKYGVFPSVSGAWKLSEEAFLANAKWISNAKLRASWGKAGNPAIKPYQSLLLGRTVNTGQGAGAGLAVGLAPTYPNPDLKWETGVQTDIGFDADFFNGRLHFSTDFYVKTTRDLLTLVSVAPSAGVGAGISSAPGQILQNAGVVRNRGWEFAAGMTVFENENWTIDLDANLSTNHNEVIETKNHKDVPNYVANDVSGSTSIIREGYPLSAFFGPKFTGLDEKGIPTYENVNGDKTTAGVDIINASDNQYLGSPYPKIFYGISPRVKYKKLTMSMLWSGVSGSLINNVGLAFLTNPTAINSANKLKVAEEFYPIPSQAAANQHKSSSSRFMESGDFFRMRNTRIGYDFGFNDSHFLKNLTVYLSGQNLITFTKYSGFDPEVNSMSGNDRRQGIDFAAYPSAKTVTIGLSATF